MKEAFEKIIEKLEELQNYACFPTEWVNEEQSKIHSYYANKLTEILKLTEQYNNGWIPCNERLPEEGGYYLVTYHGWSNGDYLPKFDDTYVRRLHYQKSERFTGWNHPRYCDDKAENDTNREVIAWQPLPQPFPKGE